jgi:hypothetical protein
VWYSAATSITSPLTRVGGVFDFTYNLALAQLNLASLTFVGGSFIIAGNPVAQLSFSKLAIVGSNFQVADNDNLTLLNVPLLTFIGGFLHLCESNAAFAVPQPPNTPSGGLVVTGSAKGMAQCRIYSGTQLCDGANTCP